MVAVPTSPLVRRLARCSCLTPQDIAVFTGAFEGRTRRLGPRREIVADGEARPIVSAIVSGWAARARTLEDGRRQIVGLLLPGDFCDLHTGLVGWMDHSVVSLTPVTVLDIPRARITRLREAAPRLTRCLIRELLVEASLAREWAVNLGRRAALERIGHLMCEVFVRLEVAGLAERDSCDFMLTQSELGDATGLSTVHVNRTLQELRASGLIVLENARLTIPDFEKFAQASGFDRGYLHLGKPQGADANGLVLCASANDCLQAREEWRTGLARFRTFRPILQAIFSRL